MRDDAFGLFWIDLPTSRKRGERVLGPIPPIPETNWKPCSPSDLPDFRNERVLSFDVETFDPELRVNGAGWGRKKGHIVGFSIASEHRAVYIPIRHEVESHLNMDPTMMLKYAQAMLGGNSDKVGANLLYDFGWMREEGVKVGGELYDCQYAEALINEQSKVGLEEIAYKYTGIGKDTDILKDWVINYYGGSTKTWRKDIYRAPVSLTGAYGERDATAPLEVIKHQIPILQANNLFGLFRMECKLIRLLCDMRFAGVSVDIPYAEQLRDDLETQEKDVQKRLDKLAGVQVNVNSTDDIATAFNKAGLIYPRTKATPNYPNGQPSFVKEFLEHHEHPLPQLITEVRGFAKLRGTFVEGYLLGSHVNGKVHGSFHPLSGTEGGARTGRFASSMPNLQNIPTRSENGKKIRKAFIKDPGHAYWEKIDYSQIEYRFLAHFAIGQGADQIRAAYSRDAKTDYHNQTQGLILAATGITLQRSYVKNIGFGLNYGMGLDKLAKDLGVSKEKAEELMAAYHQGVPFAKETMKHLADFAQRMGYITTILGRRSHFDLWEPDSWGVKGKALPYAFAVAQYGKVRRAYLYRTLNYVLQGSSADQMKKAMVTAYEAGIFDVIGVPRLTVHDELDFSMAEPNEEAMRELINIMQNVIPLRVPVIAERESGPTWGDVSKDGPHSKFMMAA